MITTAVKERPILFSDEMVRAILSGRKTQTRRVIAYADTDKDFRIIDNRLWVALSDHQYDPRTKKTIFGGECRLEDNGMFYAPIVVGHGPRGEGNPAVCPYGQPGDRLWVREAWSFYEDAQLFDCIRYRVDGAVRKPEFDKFPDVSENAWHTFEMRCDGVGCADHRWRPSIHMPRWASRITLEITDVRVQRLQEISHADALAEGVDMQPRESLINGEPGTYYPMDPTYEFAVLWQKINGPDSWNANPFVWVVAFRRIHNAS